MEGARGERGWRGIGLGLVLGLVAGCATGRVHLDEVLLADRNDASRRQEIAAAYRVACPDVLALTLPGQPDVATPLRIEADGCLKVGTARLRVEGLSVAEVRRHLAARLGVSVAEVGVEVVAYRSQQLYLLGEVVGRQRAVPYQGPETVLEVLQRTGGITPGAAVDDVYVVRTRVAEGQAPEVFRVDLPAIVLAHDESTNVRLQPFDQVFVGETRQCCLAKCIPPCLRPLYDALCGLAR